MSDPLREPGFLTAEQFNAVEEAGDFFLVACPGSGKTRTGGVRFARLAGDGLRVAATSYTNVGAEQIREVVSGKLNLLVAPHNFVGTLHGFLLRFVLYPFGHLAMGCEARPRILGEEASSWRDVIFRGNNSIRAPLSRFRFNEDGSLGYRGKLPPGIRTREEAAALGQADALRYKAQAARAGYLSADDSIYWAFCVLRDHPDIAASVAARFDELIVDEAQDTSALQLACLRELSGTGHLKSLVLIGDVEQSIYSFQGASPEGCLALVDERGLSTVELHENHRSSQPICDVAVHFCSRSEPDRAVGENSECEWSPEIILYEAAHPELAVARFRDRLASLGIAENEAAVLARANPLLDELNGQEPTSGCSTRVLAVGRAAAVVQGGGTLTQRQVLHVEQSLAYVAWNAGDLADLEPAERRGVRQSALTLLSLLPPLEGNLRQWIRDAVRSITSAVSPLADQLAHTTGQAFRSSADHERIDASGAFIPAPISLRAQTVHEVKGESRDAVLVVADRRRSSLRGHQGVLWAQPLVGEDVPAEDAEELRIAYVALTRARRYCAIALPADTDEEIIAAFVSAGFVLAPTVNEQ